MKNLITMGITAMLLFGIVSVSAQTTEVPDLAEGMEGITGFAQGCFTLVNSCIANFGWNINTCMKSCVEGVDNMISICFSRNLQALCVQMYPAFTNSAMGSLNGAIFGLIAGVVTCFATCLTPCFFMAPFCVGIGVVTGIIAGIMTGLLGALGDAELIEPKLVQPPEIEIPIRAQPGYTQIRA